MDAIREAQGRHNLPEKTAHWLSIRGMAIQAEIMLALLPEAVWLRSAMMFREQSSATGLTVLDPWRFLREEDPRLGSCPLPETWDVTSDSIAARAAQSASAAELVLLKSALPMVATIPELAESGYVDRYFPDAARALARLRLVDLPRPGLRRDHDTSAT